MDIRVLNYYLAVAREGNISKAAESLHITQPTLSRQMMDLEAELGTQLFIRGKRQIALTESGVLFQQRASEIVTLLEKTQRDLTEHNELIGGTVSIGCVETVASHYLPLWVTGFSKLYPIVQYEFYSADGDDIREKLDRGSIDLGIFLEPIETAKYDGLRLPAEERWGVLLHRDDPLANEKSISPKALERLPLIVPRRQIVKEELEHWLGIPNSQLNVIASHNLLTNMSLLAAEQIGYVICVEGAHTIRPSENVCFVPFYPERKTGHVLAWKKNKVFGTATEKFIAYIQQLIQVE